MKAAETAVAEIPAAASGQERPLSSPPPKINSESGSGACDLERRGDDRKALSEFLRLRDLLIRNRNDFETAQREFAWPDIQYFNWSTDYFDQIAAGNDKVALRVVDDHGLDQAHTFAQLSRRSAQVANFFVRLGVRRSDRVLVMLGNVAPLWESMLALIKLGAVIIPATTLLQKEELEDRLLRGEVKAIIAESELIGRFEKLADKLIRIAVGDAVPDWEDYSESARESDSHISAAPTPARDDLFLYFTSGTTSKPKLVAHSHVSYPIGHLSTLYWLGLRPKDVHLNLSSAGWAKHAWSCFFAPWNAEATIIAYQYSRFDARALLDRIVESKITTFCAPPTVWRLLVQQPLSNWKVSLREVASAGEPLNGEVIRVVQEAWGLTIRDGFGQTETTALVGNPPGQPIKIGSMGRPLPGCPVTLLSPAGEEANEGEICVALSGKPLGVTSGYAGDELLTAERMKDGYYRTGDIATRDSEGYLTYVGRADDVFKSSDYRISPFELESIIIEHEAVVEAAVVPSLDPIRLAVPKAFIVLVEGYVPCAEIASSILAHIRQRVSPFKRVRRLEFGVLPKTVSGKIRRVDLKKLEEARDDIKERRPNEFWEEDFS